MHANRLLVLVLPCLLVSQVPVVALPAHSDLVQPPRAVAGTELGSDSAEDLKADGSWVRGAFEKRDDLDGAARWRLFRARSTEAGTLSARLIATADGSTYRLSLFDSAGQVVRTGYSAGVQQHLLWSWPEGQGQDAILGVELVEQAPSGGGEFEVSISPLRADDIIPEIGSGIAYRERLSVSEYQELMDFGRRDFMGLHSSRRDASVGGSSDCAVGRMYQVARRFISGGEVAGLPGSNEPIISFFGIAGVNRVLLLRGDPGGRVGCDVPLQTSLGRARSFWVLSLEDDAAPFDTFIDVEFRQRAQRVDYEEFDPTVQARVRTSLAAAGRRTPAQGTPDQTDGTLVRVALKRFQVREPPVAIEVAFSRQGAAYGLRQWQRSYSVTAWTSTRLSVSLFVPFVPVTIDKHDVIPPGLSSGAMPNFEVIVKEEDDQYIFGGALLSFPQLRARRQNALSRGSRLAWGLIPDVTGGVALLNTRVWYLGAAWPLLVDRVFLTAGIVLKDQEKLKEGYVEGYSLVGGVPVAGGAGAPIEIEVGARLPPDYPVDTLTYRTLVVTPVIGVTVNFLLW